MTHGCERCGGNDGRIALCRWNLEELHLRSAYLCPRCQRDVDQALADALKPVGAAAGL